MGIEPTTPGATVQCSDQLSYGHHGRCDDRSYGALQGVSTGRAVDHLPHVGEPFARRPQRCLQEAAGAVDREPGAQRPPRALPQGLRVDRLHEASVETERVAYLEGEGVAVERKGSGDVRDAADLSLDQLD